MASAKQTVQSNASTNVKTSIFEKISYGMGDVACNVVFALTSGLITYFYTNVMSVSAACAALPARECTCGRAGDLPLYHI